MVIIAASLVSAGSTLQPVGGPAAVTVKSDTANFAYVPLSGELTFEVDGPASVRIVTRKILENVMEHPVYQLGWSLDGRDPSWITCNGVVTVKSMIPADPGKILSTFSAKTLAIPAGKHKLTLHGRTPLLVRVSSKALKLKKPPKEMTPFAPQKYAAAVMMLYKEKEYRYYRASAEAPCELELIGPTRIVVGSRYIYRDTPASSARYNIVAEMDGKPLREFYTESVQSDASTLKDDPTVRLGTLNRFELDVPAGKHVIDFRPATQTELIMHFEIPTKDIKR